MWRTKIQFMLKIKILRYILAFSSFKKQGCKNSERFPSQELIDWLTQPSPDFHTFDCIANHHCFYNLIYPRLKIDFQVILCLKILVYLPCLHYTLSIDSVSFDNQVQVLEVRMSFSIHQLICSKVLALSGPKVHTNDL